MTRVKTEVQKWSLVTRFSSRLITEAVALFVGHGVACVRFSVPLSLRVPVLTNASFDPVKDVRLLAVFVLCDIALDFQYLCMRSNTYAYSECLIKHKCCMIHHCNHFARVLAANIVISTTQFEGDITLMDFLRKRTDGWTSAGLSCVFNANRQNLIKILHSRGLVGEAKINGPCFISL